MEKLLEKFGDRSIEIRSPLYKEAMETENKNTIICLAISIDFIVLENLEVV